MHPQDPTPPSRWRSPLGIFMLVAGAVVVHGLHALEKRFVHGDRIAVRGELRGHPLLDGLERVVHGTAGKPEEDLHGAGEIHSALLDSHDGVLEGGGLGVVDDKADFFELLLHPGLYGGLVVRVLQFVEDRGLEHERALGGKRVLHGVGA